jgi:hypothetical protein
MYSLYQLAALLALWALYRFWTTSESRWGWLSAGAIVLSMGAHAIGSTLAVVFVLIAVRTSKIVHRIAAILVIPVLALLSRFQTSFVGSSLRGNLPTVSRTHGEPVAESAAAAAASAGGAPQPGLGVELLGTWPAGALVLILAVVGIVLAAVSVRTRSYAARAFAASGVAGVLVLAGLGRLGLAVSGFLLLVVLCRELFPDPEARRCLILTAALIALAGVAWGGAGLVLGHAPRELVFDLSGRVLGRLWRFLIQANPAVSLFALIGFGAVLVRSWRDKATDAERFLVASSLCIITGRALVAGKTTSRYLADIWPLWEMLAALVVAATVVGVLRRLKRFSAPVRYVGVIGLTTLIIGSLPGANPLDTLRYLRRDHGTPPPGASRAVGFTPDFRGVRDWLSGRIEDGDRIVATDWLSTYCYLGRVDGWIRSKGYARQCIMVDGVPRDIYLRARVLPDLEAIESFTSSAPVWIVAGGNELGKPEFKLAPDVQEWLLAQEPLFVARDGETRVFRKDPVGQEQR